MDELKKVVEGQMTFEHLQRLLEVFKGAGLPPETKLTFGGKPVLMFNIDRDTGEVVIET